MGIVLKDKRKYNTQRECQIIEFLLGAHICKELKEVDAVLAGGAITSIFTGTEINDLDLFFKDQDSFHTMNKYIQSIMTPRYGNRTLSNPHDYGCIGQLESSFETKRASSITAVLKEEFRVKSRQADYGPTFELSYLQGKKLNIQLVKPEICGGSVLEILHKFDYTACMGAFKFSSREFEFDDRFFPDNCKRVLSYNTEAGFPYNSWIRSKKYQQKGYEFPRSEELKLLMTIVRDTPKTYGDFLNQLEIYAYGDLYEHIKNLIKYPTDNIEIHKEKSREEESFNPEEVIDWMEDFKLNGTYIPQYLQKGAPEPTVIVEETDVTQMPCSSPTSGQVILPAAAPQQYNSSSSVAPKTATQLKGII